MKTKMTTYCGQLRAGDKVYDVIVVDVSVQKGPAKFKVDYQKSIRGLSPMFGNGLEEAAMTLRSSDEFKEVSGRPYKHTTVLPNGTGKGKLEAKIQNFLMTVKQ